MTEKNNKLLPGEAMAARVVGWIMVLPRAVIGVLILVSITLNFANVIGRYVFLSPIIWAEEVMIFLMVWCVFIGAVVVSWEDRHLRMDLVSQHLPSPWKELLNGIVAVASLGMFALIVTQSWQAVSLFASLGQRSTTAGIPMVIPHSAVLIGFALMFVAVAARFRAIVTGTLSTDVDAVADAYRDSGTSDRG